MTKSTIKEKGLEKDFSALNRITKPKKNDESIKHKSEELVSADSLLSGFFNEKSQTVHVASKENVKPEPISQVVQPKTIVEPISKPMAAPIKIADLKVEEIIREPRKIEIEDAPELPVNIATKLKHNNKVETLSSPKNIENVVEQPEVPVRTSASLAKDRLNLVIHGVEPVKEVEALSVSSQESQESSDKVEPYKKTANDSLNRIFGQPLHNDQAPNASAMPLVNNQQNVNVEKSKSLIIPWDKASESEKKKARKIMSACVAGVVGMIAIGTFH